MIFHLQIKSGKNNLSKWLIKQNWIFVILSNLACYSLEGSRQKWDSSLEKSSKISSERQHFAEYLGWNYWEGKMFFIKFFNSRLKEHFTIWDIKLAQLAAMFVLIILIKLIPEIISLNYWVYIVGLIISAIRPMYVMFIKK